jgi:hypothetical protein
MVQTSGGPIFRTPEGGSPITLLATAVMGLGMIRWRAHVSA